MLTLAPVPPPVAPAPTVRDEEVGESPAILSQIAAGILPITMAFPLDSLAFTDAAAPPQTGGDSATQTSGLQQGAGVVETSAPPPTSAGMLGVSGAPGGSSGPWPGLDVPSPVAAPLASNTTSVPGGLLQQVRSPPPPSAMV